MVRRVSEAGGSESLTWLDGDMEARIGEMVRGLEAATDSGDFSGVNSPSYADRLAAVEEGVYRVARKGPFGVCGGATVWFGGEIWLGVPQEVAYRVLKVWLRGAGVRSDDMSRGFRAVLSSFYTALRIYRRVSPRYDVQAYLNGVLDMKTLELRPFSPSFPVVYRHPYAYDPSARCPLWQSFLREVLPERESRLTLQMYLGLCTFDRGSMEDKVESCLMLYGAGCNGKSVITDTVRGVFGDGFISGFGLMEMIRGTDERYRNWAAMDGKIINVCPEVQAKDISGYEDAFKSICSGEPQRARRIGGDVYTVYNVPRLIFNMNSVPRASDPSFGYFRRFLYLVFDTVIPESRRNRRLASELRAEYPGILNWILRGGLYLRRRGYVFPRSAASRRLALENMASANVTLSWLAARSVRLEPAVEGEVYAWAWARDLYADMEAYCRANGFEPCTSTEFGRRLAEQGFNRNKRRVAGGVQYRVYGFDPARAGLDVPVLADDAPGGPPTEEGVEDEDL